jgi:hypothetical protein
MVASVSFEPKSLVELAQFLEENKDTYHEIWIIITNKKTQNPQSVSFRDVVNEAKKQGLIDSLIKNIDDKKYMIRLTKKNKIKILKNRKCR